jgi:DMSO/TMAO reductase YedYZ molybdopterin-dependent catalytic subunit
MPELPRAPAVSIDTPENREIAADALTLPITPTEAHFVRNHFTRPVPSFEVTVGGAVAHPRRFTLEALRALEQRTRPVTLECAGNGRLGMAPLPPGEPWRRGAVSTAIWTGVPLSALLAEVRPRDDVVELLVRGADRGTPAGAPGELAYERALPLGEEALLALEMNGEPIPLERGGPIRLVVPGWYGMASVKWVTAIEALTDSFEGWFHTHQYVYDDGPVTTLRPSSRILAPAEGSLYGPGVVQAWGWAWSAMPIVGVQVSLDAGPWRPAALAEPETAGAWIRWQAALEVVRPGSHSLRARSRDATGQVQPEAPVRNRLGYGNNSVETVRFSVSRP